MRRPEFGAKNFPYVHVYTRGVCNRVKRQNPGAGRVIRFGYLFGACLAQTPIRLYVYCTVSRTTGELAVGCLYLLFITKARITVGGGAKVGNRPGRWYRVLIMHRGTGTVNFVTFVFFCSDSDHNYNYDDGRMESIDFKVFFFFAFCRRFFG